jgi:hypothetical protein
MSRGASQRARAFLSRGGAAGGSGTGWPGAGGVDGGAEQDDAAEELQGRRRLGQDGGGEQDRDDRLQEQ